MSKALGIALVGGVSAWTAHLLLSYLLADLGCRGDSWMLLAGRHALTLVAAASVIVVTMAVRPFLGGQSSVTGGARLPAVSTQAVGPSMTVRPFLARVALILNGMFLFAILLAGVTSVFLVPCV